MASPMSLRSYKSMGPEGQAQTAQSSGGSTKGLNIQYVVQLTEVGEGLKAKMYRLNQVLDHPDPVNHLFSESFWKASVIPNFPKICTLVARKFPEHTSRLQLERVSMVLTFVYLLFCLIKVWLLIVFGLVLVQVDKVAFDSLTDGAEVYLQNLEPWVQV